MSPELYLLDTSALMALIEDEAGAERVEQRVSFADALIAAFALRTGATLIHKDPEYDALTDVVDMERLPYKDPQEHQRPT